MSKNSSKKPKAKKAREKRAYEQARVQGTAPAENGAASAEARTAPSRGETADVRRPAAASAPMPTVGQIKMLRLMNLFRIAGVLIIALAVVFLAGALSEGSAASVLALIGYVPDEYLFGSPQVFAGLEGLFAAVLGVLCLIVSARGRGWLRGVSSYGRFIVLVQVSAGISIFWFVACLFVPRFVEPVSGLAIVLFLVMLRVISRLRRESGA